MNPFGNLSKPQLIIIGSVLLVVIIVVLGIAGIIPIFKSDEGDQNLPKTASLSVWGLTEDMSAFQDLIASYKASSAQVKEYRIEYTPFKTKEELEKRLVNALAEGSGPDIFYFHNSWKLKHGGKVYPAYPTLVSGMGKFPQTVTDDFVAKTDSGSSVILALPLHMDSLVLYYNKDIVESVGIKYEEETWNHLTWEQALDMSRRIKTTSGTTITRAGIALGTTDNIEQSADIVTALLMQSGFQTLYENGKATLGTEAEGPFKFYMQFASPDSPAYTWNESFGNARDAFAKGSVGMIVDYLSAYPELQKKNSFLRIGVVPLPQLTADASVKRTVASYGGLAVSRMSAQKYAAWHFVSFVTMRGESANKKYLEATEKYPALTSLMGNTGGQEEIMNSFLYARSWAKKDPEIVDNALLDVIRNVRKNRMDLRSALSSAEQKINK